jgi:hypothetical protein
MTNVFPFPTAEARAHQALDQAFQRCDVEAILQIALCGRTPAAGDRASRWLWEVRNVRIMARSK